MTHRSVSSSAAKNGKCPRRGFLETLLAGSLCLHYCLLRRPTLALKLAAIRMMQPEKIRVGLVEFVQRFLDFQGERLNNRRGLFIIYCWREPRERSGKIADTLQRLLQAAGLAECVFLGFCRGSFDGHGVGLPWLSHFSKSLSMNIISLLIVCRRRFRNFSSPIREISS